MKFYRFLYSTCTFLLATACITDVEVGRSSSAQSDPGPVSVPDSSVPPMLDAEQIFVPGCVQVACRGRPAACADCLDNDGDGRLDVEDPDCYGPCDDSEVNFNGSRQPCPSDACFFDTDCGEGNDARCETLIPNGCDCHGCCEVEGGDPVYLGTMDGTEAPTCNSSSLDDPESCQPCTLDPDCHNTCQSCELCFSGGPVPASCAADGGGCAMPRCEEGVRACSPECGVECADGEVCVTGCCIAL